jgi:signal transduction histidine kinase
VAGFTLLQGSNLVPRGVLVSAMLAFACLPGPAVVRSIRWSATSSPSGVAALPFLAALVLGGSVILVAFRDRHTRIRLQTLVEHVANPIASLPHKYSPVNAQFYVPHTGRWVDALGRWAPDVDGRAVDVSDSAGPIVRLFVRPGYRSDDVTEAMTPSLRLAVKTSQLLAISRANLAEVQASRRRIVATSDAERRRIERDLHDGAQQRLVALSLSLRLALAKLDSNPIAVRAALAEAGDELGRALEELRELARGLHPAVLSDRGLRAAVEVLAGRVPVPVEIADIPDERLPEPIEAGAYYLIAEALTNVTKYAQASTVRVRVASSAASCVVEVSDDGVGGADPATGSGLRGLADRVAALGGSLEVVSPAGGGTSLRAEIPK